MVSKWKTTAQTASKGRAIICSRCYFTTAEFTALSGRLANSAMHLNLLIMWLFIWRGGEAQRLWVPLIQLNKWVCLVSGIHLLLRHFKSSHHRNVSKQVIQFPFPEAALYKLYPEAEIISNLPNSLQQSAMALNHCQKKIINDQVTVFLVEVGVCIILVSKWTVTVTVSNCKC